MTGTLLGFDDFVNMLLEDVTEVENTPEGKRITKLDQILLNGNNISKFKEASSFVHMPKFTLLLAMLVPGGFEIPE